MNLRHLHYFVGIADVGSFTKAATRLGVAQPALTRHIRQLEADYGVELFSRNSRGVTLTDAGKHFYDRVRQILRDVDRVSDEMLSFRGDPSGTVVLGMAPSLCPVAVPPLLLLQKQTYPRIHLKIVESPGRQLEEWLADRKIDLAIHTEPATNRALAFTPLVSEEMVLLATPRSKIRGPLRLEKLASMPLTMTESLHGLIERLLEPSDITLTVETTLNAIPTILLMTKSGLCNTVMPFSVVQADVASGTLRAYRLGKNGLMRNVVLSVATSRPVTAATRAVSNCIREVFQSLSQKHGFYLPKKYQ